MTFYQYFYTISKDKIWKKIKSTRPEHVESTLDKKNWNITDFPTLISEAARPFLDKMRGISRKLTRSSFSNTMELYAPLYISNHCLNACTYCGFNVRNKIPRHTLSLDEIVQEALHLKSEGFQSILILSGEHRDEVPVETFEAIGNSLSPLFEKLAIEIYPLTEVDYMRLYQSGINGITVYQETYSQSLYPRFHRGPKADFIHRLETPERAARAGFTQLGIGSLLGLANPQIELWAVATHGDWLSKQFPDRTISVSFPRIRNAEGDFTPDYSVNDDLLMQAIYALRMVMPRLDLVLSTREMASFRDLMADSGISRMSAGSKTSPGGYSLGDTLKMRPVDSKAHALEQFQISDSRSPHEVVTMLKNQGLNPINWTAE
jgi:2-iminoacetate synthase